MKLQYKSIPVIVSFPVVICISILTIREKYPEFLSDPLAFLGRDILQSLLIFSFLIPFVVFILQYWKIYIDEEKLIYKDYLLTYIVKYKLTFFWKDIIDIRIYRNAYSAIFTLNTKEGIREFNAQMSQKQVLAILSFIEDKNISYNYRDDLNPRLSKKSNY